MDGSERGRGERERGGGEGEYKLGLGFGVTPHNGGFELEEGERRGVEEGKIAAYSDTKLN